ncbi:MAG: DoxX family protein, partial [Acidimicrobiales bacterium]|nr:DoxX family protein [Acidimicrobiales bacterium]
MLVRRLARPMLASIFVSEGVHTLQNPGPRAQLAEPVVERIAEAAQPVAQKAAAAGQDKIEEATSVIEEVVSTAADKVDEAAHGAEGTAGSGSGPGDPAGSTAAWESESGSIDGPGGAGEDTTATPGPAVAVANRAAESARAASAKLGDVSTEVRTVVAEVAAGRPLPFETETYVKVNAAVQVGAGVLLSLGKLPRLSSAALAASMIPTTLAGHRFWEAEGLERQSQQVHFFKNVSILGGLILAAVDTEGRPGLHYRASHAGHDAKVVAHATAATAALGSRAIKANAKAAGRLAAANAADAGAASRRRARAAGK